MFAKVVREAPYMLKFVPDHFKMQEMCNRAVDVEPDSLEFVPDRL